MNIRKCYNNIQVVCLQILIDGVDLMDVHTRAIALLKKAYGATAEFREGQLDAITSVVKKNKTLVVQKTGWGKSSVYFIATKILRENGSGPSIIISPLLDLMQNQIDSANRFGLNVVTINSNNKDTWDESYSQLSLCDALIISPERLANDQFMEHLSGIKNIQLFVVDEAHSISDWGHDFRPDYQRIIKLLKFFPANISILATTATANNRVIEDIKNQLGNDVHILRGDLIRDNLAIQINPSQNREQRLAWLVQSLTSDNNLKDEQGIIYCLTQRDCETVADFLQQNNINAASYHSGLELKSSQERIDGFDKGNIKILVATIKLGMGYDKSNIRFVIHYQLPNNLISYYQQIGRAGRDGNKAFAVLLHGQEEEEILNFFIEDAQAKPELLQDILNHISYGCTHDELLSQINVTNSKLGEALKYLTVHDYIYKEKKKYLKNPTLNFDGAAEKENQLKVTQLRKDELERLKNFISVKTCYMKFISDELDAPDKKTKCTICTNCINHYLINTEVHPDILKLASNYLHNKHGKITPRKQWRAGESIPEAERYQEGWVLTEDYYSEIGKLVQNGKYDHNFFSNDLVELSVDFLNRKVSDNSIDLIVPIPSLRRKTLVPRLAKSISEKLGLPYLNALDKIDQGAKQKMLKNSILQQDNIKKTVEVNTTDITGKKILLIDDMVDSKWSFTVIAAKLLNAGASAVYPYALVKTGPGN